MPQPGTQAPRAMSPMLSDLIGSPADALLTEVTLLREEVAALRRDLLDAPSVICTGREAVEFFQRLERRANQEPA